jgi:tetratricopeptide (TPR) repeat protein
MTEHDTPVPDGEAEAGNPVATRSVIQQRRYVVVIVVVALLLGLLGFGIGRVTSPDTGSGGQSSATSTPDSIDQLLIEAVALHSGGLVDQAAGRYEQVLVIEPNNAIALYNLGQIAQIRGALADAIGYYERAIVADPDFTSAEFNRAVALRDLGRTSEAIAAFEAIIEQDPDSVGALFNLGNLYISEGDALRGVALVNRAVELDPGLRGD